jgi:beta-ring hydroxylase
MALWHPTRKFVIVADADVAKHILLTNVSNYDKGMLTELMDFFLGTGLITANGEIAVTRRKAIQPAFHLCVLPPFASLVM